MGVREIAFGYLLSWFVQGFPQKSLYLQPHTIVTDTDIAVRNGYGWLIIKGETWLTTIIKIV